MIWHPYTVQKNSFSPLSIHRGKAEFLYDQNGREYIDAIASWWIAVHGHNHPRIMEAIHKQLLSLDHVILAGYTHPKAEEFAEKLLQFTGSNFSHVMYSDNGSTAVEIAAKIAYQYFQNKGKTGKREMIHFSASYHGDTIGMMSLAGDSPLNRVFHSLFFDSREFPSPNCLDCPLSKNPNTCQTECLDSMENYFRENHESVAAVIIEPLVMAAGGMVFYQSKVLSRLRKITEEYDVLLIFDEVFTGFGRIAPRFAFMDSVVTPDLLALAKALSGGAFPMAVTLSTKKVFSAFDSADPMHAFYHGHTMSGSPIGCAAGIASLEIFEEEGRSLDTVRLEGYFRNWAIELERDFPDIVRQIRLRGATCVLELQKSNLESGYLSSLGKTIQAVCEGNGVLLRPLGNLVYLTPPLCIQDSSLEQVFSSVKKGIQALREEK